MDTHNVTKQTDRQNREGKGNSPPRINVNGHFIFGTQNIKHIESHVGAALLNNNSTVVAFER